jgi:hypothetical protein
MSRIALAKRFSVITAGYCVPRATLHIDQAAQFWAKSWKCGARNSAVLARPRNSTSRELCALRHRWLPIQSWASIATSQNRLHIPKIWMHDAICIAEWHYYLKPLLYMNYITHTKA